MSNDTLPQEIKDWIESEWEKESRGTINWDCEGGFLLGATSMYHHLSPRIKELEYDQEKKIEICDFLLDQNKRLAQRVKELEDVLRDIDKSLYLGKDLDDIEILKWYIDVAQTIKESSQEILTRSPAASQFKPVPDEAVAKKERGHSTNDNVKGK